jgi:hypothetical protein
MKAESKNLIWKCDEVTQDGGYMYDCQVVPPCQRKSNVKR